MSIIEKIMSYDILQYLKYIGYGLLTGIIGYVFRLIYEKKVYKPDLKVDLTNYKYIFENEKSGWGPTYENEPDVTTSLIILNAELIVFNKGRAPTAIKSIKTKVSTKVVNIISNYPRVEEVVLGSGDKKLNGTINVSPGTINEIKIMSYFDIKKIKGEVDKILREKNIEAEITIVDIYDKKIIVKLNK